MTDSNPQTNPNDVPSAADVPAAAEGQQQQEQRRGGGRDVVTAVADAVVTDATRSVTPSGRSGLSRSAACPRP